MKAMKLALVAILIASTAVCFANADGFHGKPNKVISCTLAKALTDPGLVAAMHAQLNPDFLNNNQLVYTVNVYYGGNLYRISGSEIQWRLFFNPKWKVKTEIKPTFTTKD